MNLIIDHEKGFAINIVKTKKFRTVRIEIMFVKKMIKKEKLKRELLERIFNESSLKYKNRSQIKIECENNYNQKSWCENYFWGDNNNLEYITEFINEKYLEKGHNQKCVDFFFEILFRPNVINGEYDRKSFLIAVKELKADKKNVVESVARYSLEQARRHANVINSYDAADLNQIDKISAKDLATYFEKMVNNDFMEVTIVGDVDKDLINYIKQKLETRKTQQFKMERIVHQINKKEIIEKSNFSQSSLVFINKIKDGNIKDRDVMAVLYNYLLGGGSNSKLFLEIREKHSLCYDISSKYFRLLEMLQIRTAISRKDYQKVKQLIIKQINDIEKGNFSLKELENVKKRFLKRIYLNDESTSGIAGTVITEKYGDLIKSEELKKIIKIVTKKDIIKFAKKIKIDTIFFLEGKNEKIDN